MKDVKNISLNKILRFAYGFCDYKENDYEKIKHKIYIDAYFAYKCYLGMFAERR